MAGIAKRIALYNSAYRLAWKYITADQKLRRPDITRVLHDAIRRQMKNGVTDAVFVASKALEDVEATISGERKGSERARNT